MEPVLRLTKMLSYLKLLAFSKYHYHGIAIISLLVFIVTLSIYINCINFDEQIPLPMYKMSKLHCLISYYSIVLHDLKITCVTHLKMNLMISE